MTPDVDVRDAASSSSPRRLRWRGIALLGAIGAVIGFVLGTLLFVLVQLASGGRESWLDATSSMMFGGTFGALVGAIGAPLFGVLLLRHVRLSTALVGTAVGTALGGAVGHFVFDSPVWGGLVGFGVGAVALAVGARIRLRGARPR